MLTEKNIIVIGDVHGRTSWKQIVDKHPGCRLVFLGDYCDPYEKIPGEAVLENLMEIIRQFRKAQQYAASNVSPAAICSYLQWNLR